MLQELGWRNLDGRVWVNDTLDESIYVSNSLANLLDRFFWKGHSQGEVDQENKYVPE